MFTRINTTSRKITAMYSLLGQHCGLVKEKLATSREGRQQALLFSTGLMLLFLGLSFGAQAQGLETNYNQERMSASVNALLTYLEGSFGALVMVASGVGAILSSAFGQYKAALSCLVVAVGSFILRSMLGTFFNDVEIAE